MKILKESSEVLTNLIKEHPKYKLIITGHSLGAGSAELVTMDIVVRNISLFDQPLDFSGFLIFLLENAR